MKKELIISTANSKTTIAILYEKILTEFYTSSPSDNSIVGDIYIGIVKKISKNLNSCFINIGENKDAFLHYNDISPYIHYFKKINKYIGKSQIPNIDNFNLENPIPKIGDICNIIQQGEKIIVQITKEPIHTKGARVSSEISIAGRYIVLIPISNRISISRNISNIEEKNRLLNIIKPIMPKNFGAIIRTAAYNKHKEEIHEDIKIVLKKWNNLLLNLNKNKKYPKKILNEIDIAYSILRDNFSNEYSKVIVDDVFLANQMKNYLKVIAPNKTNIIKIYDNKIIPIFEKYNIEKQIKQSFGKIINLPKSKGAYIIIEHTEALHVIDVNSGNYSNKTSSEEEYALYVNKIAATEIARQIKLRNMGGIIVIDFIDMNKNENKTQLFEHLKSEMITDKAKHKILPPSKFGLIQITRQRVREELIINTLEEISEKNNLKNPIRIINDIDNKLYYIIKKKYILNPIYVYVHPFIEAYINKGFFSIKIKWILKHKRYIKIIPLYSYKYLQFNISNKEK